MPVLVDRLYQEGWGDLRRWAAGDLGSRSGVALRTAEREAVKMLL